MRDANDGCIFKITGMSYILLANGTIILFELFDLCGMLTERQRVRHSALSGVLTVRRRAVKLAFHDSDTDTDILADILARKSVSASWNASFNPLIHNVSSNKGHLFSRSRV